MNHQLNIIILLQILWTYRFNKHSINHTLLDITPPCSIVQSGYCCYRWRGLKNIGTLLWVFTYVCWAISFCSGKGNKMVTCRFATGPNYCLALWWWSWWITNMSKRTYKLQTVLSQIKPESHFGVYSLIIIMSQYANKPTVCACNWDKTCIMDSLKLISTIYTAHNYYYVLCSRRPYILRYSFWKLEERHKERNLRSEMKISVLYYVLPTWKLYLRKQLIYYGSNYIGLLEF